MTADIATTAKSAGTATPVLSVQDLTVSARRGGVSRVLVDSLSFSIGRGETLAIAGESGSGKSITSLAIMGLLPPAVRATSGQVRLASQDLLTLNDTAMQGIRGSRIAMIFQEPMTSLNPIMTIGSQLSEAITAHEQISRRKARERALAALQSVRISQPERRLTQYPHELSGGMRQRVMIAMALAMKPDILIADEPTTALDVTVQREVLDLLRDLQRETGTALILITHDMGVVAEMATQVIVMKSGRVVEHGPVQQIFHAAKSEYTQDLLAALPRMGKGERPARQPIAGEAPIARLKDVQVSFDLHGGFLQRITHRIHAVENVSFEIFPGETFALVGESGCGKSTIAKALVGLVPHSGKIEIDGKAVGTLTSEGKQRLCRDIQMVFQDPMAALDPRMTAGDLTAEPLVIHNIGSRESRRARVDELFARVGLPEDSATRYPHEFSGGQRQRICIARALALQPKLIICDESVSALDVSVQARVLNLLEALKNEFGIAYLFISHDMAVVENIADRVAVMYMGQIVEMGSRSQIFGNPQHAYTRRLIDAVPVPDPAYARPLYIRPTGEVPSPVYPVGATPAKVQLTDTGGGHFVGS